MGYVHKIPRIDVSFPEDHEYHGCEATLRRLKLGEWLDITGLGGNSDKPLVRNVGDQLLTMADKLISWNLEAEDGTPVPTTVEAVLEQDQGLMMAILGQWLDGLAGVSAPLEPSSTDGELSQVASIPMDTLSSSLVS
ncbi:hypothetical protein OG592_26970 [Streptomyces avidinii]|uniref:hypothetical protein n=1 Tax=Streptomyces avidinii TaxID=1895 RepID=UPI00386846D3|nr:hypothetical protein OG592_26970 [Streptomyces avidinii]